MRPATNPSPSSDEGDAVEPYRDIEEPSDELLTAGGLSRGFQIGGVLLAVAVLVVILATKLAGSAGDPEALPSPFPSSVPTELPQPPVFDRSRALDVALAGDSQWSVEGDRLIRSAPDRRVRSVPLGFLHLHGEDQPSIATDLAHRLVWIVVANSVPTRVVAYDSRTLARVAATRWAQSVYGAAAVNGYLYLANDLGVVELSPGAMQPRFVAGLRGAIGPVAADPVRQRLIVVDASSPIGVWSYRHGQNPYESEIRLPMGHGTLAVADGNIWIGGYGERGAMLYRLDPRTLQPIAGGRASVFDPGAVLLAGGRDVIWVRDGDESPGLLVCVNATSGRIEQRFHLLDEVTAIASTGGYAVLAITQGVLNLELIRCTG